ncbi:uncharacterized protein LOC114520949 isoform X2 [Dendronephthya gigantea]|nr:uncharacterized protein LOC114520949 isoform X2 [Dendronephthya gigantea]
MEERMKGWYTNSYKFTSPHDPLWLTQPTLQTLVKKGNYWSNPNKDGRLIYIPRFRGRGGTSRVYGAIVRRASPAVLDLWPNGWKHEDMTQYYKKLEDHYCYYDLANVTGIPKNVCEKWHGHGGPMQVNSQVQEAFQKFPRTMKYLCEDKEKPWNGYKSDYNGPESDRISCSVFQQYKLRTDKDYYPSDEARRNRASKTARGSSYTGYYEHNDAKPYLSVSAPVSQIIFDGERKAVGVSYWDKTTGEIKVANARKEVILGGGTFDTPHLLQVSGVGPRNLLKKIGVELVAENEEVGKNLWDHISVPYVLELSKESLELCCTNETDPIPRVDIDGASYETKKLESINGPFSWILHYRSNITRVPKKMSDIQLYVMGNSKLFDETDALCTSDPPEYNDQDEEDESHDKDTIQGTIRIIDQWPEYRGSVKSVTPHIFDKPEIEYGWSYTKDGVPSDEFKKVSQLFREQVKLLREMFFGDNVREDLKRLVVSEVAPGHDIDTDDKFDAWLRGMLVSALHPVGTCKMPECSDEFLRVKGVSSLRVCDASAFATQIDGNPAATLYAMGEKLADMLKFEYLKYIKLAVRVEIPSPMVKDADLPFLNRVKKDITSRLQAECFQCFEVSLTPDLISTGKDTSAMIFKWSIVCTQEVNERKIVDFLVKETLSGRRKASYCNADSYPEFNRKETSTVERESGPRHKVDPYVFVVWCQGYSGVNPDSLWKKAGAWHGEGGKVPGSKNCFKLNCEKETCSVLEHANDANRELIYKEPDLNLPASGYVSTKKVVARDDGGSSAFFRTSAMIASPEADWYKDVAGYLLETVYASSGRRYARQYPPLDSQSGWWTELPGGLLIYETSSRIYSRESVAAFDLDGTIIKTKSGKDFPIDKNDWIFTSQEVKLKLEENQKGGINNVIMSNQGGIGLGLQDKLEWMEKIEDITSQLNIPIFVLAATKENNYRKPDVGMWEYYYCTLNQFKMINMKTAIYVGDAAGRPNDHGDSDRKFAENVGIAFQTPEEYFEKTHSEL